MPGSRRDLSGDEKRIIALLGLPSFGLALAATTVVTYTPLITKQFTSSTTIVGLTIAVEGLVALFVPVLAGSWSDHLRTRLGGRLPFLIGGLVGIIVTLAWISFARNLIELIILLAIFFTAYYVAYEPYRALYPDLIKDSAAGRAQSGQAVWRGLGTGVALTGGGFLLAATIWLPFMLAAVLVLISTLLFLLIMLKRRGVPEQDQRRPESFKDSYVNTFKLLKEQTGLRAFVVANGLWELTLAALKSFILLYITVGLGHSKAIAATIISVTAIIMIISAPIGGKLADRYGKIRVARVAALIFGLGLLVPGFFAHAWLILPILPIGAFGGAIVLTLPYAIMMPMMPAKQHGKLTGLYSASRGLGIMLGPLLTGVAISLGKHHLPAQGYSAMWLVCAAAMLTSIVPLSVLKSNSA